MAEDAKEKEELTVREVIEQQIGYLGGELNDLEPNSPEYVTVEKNMNELLDRLIKINEVEFKAQNEIDQREHEAKMKAQELEAKAKEAEAEAEAKAREEAETKRWHTIDMCLRIGTMAVSLLTIGTWTGLNIVQTRMNYFDNVYDASPASKNLFNAIGKMIKPPM